jgi:mRNA interferase MazF
VIVGDIHWVQLPAANGREQQGRRPAVILQDDQSAGGLPIVLVIPLTTARAAMRFARTALIRPTAENGLHQASVALMFQLRTMIDAAFRSVLAALARRCYTRFLRSLTN